MRIIAAVAVMILPLLYVWERVDLVQVGYRIEHLKAEHRALERVHDELRVKVSALTSLERLARVATDQLGMIKPRPGQVVLVSLEPEGSGVRGLDDSEIRLARTNRHERRP